MSAARLHDATPDLFATSDDGRPSRALRAAIDAQVCLVSNLYPRLSTAQATAVRVGWEAVYAALPAGAGERAVA